ncbi:hypothetical protein HFN72_35980, partial [Rhizobium laguerreae]|nr:hypothetical protein [Rhizobium laguerreae]
MAMAADFENNEEYHIVANCPICGVPAEAWPSGLPKVKWTADGFHGETAEQVELECETCDHSFDVTVRAHRDGWEVYLSADPVKKGMLEHLVYDDWIDEIPPESHPRAIFDEAIREWTRLLETIGDKRSGSAGTNRMLLVQLFSILEAYLADAIIKLVSDEPEIAAAIVQWHPELKDEQISLKRVATEPDLVRNVVVAQLRKTQFHRFEFVNGMLRACDLAPKFYPVLSSLQRFLVAVVGSVAAGCGAEPFRLRSTASRR